MQGVAAADGVIVLDTNIVLDLFVFRDPATLGLHHALQSGSVRWLVTAAMRDELERVLAYAQIARRLSFYDIPSHGVLAQMDAFSYPAAAAPKAVFTCKDPDDQKFVDLAVAHGARLLSKDRAVLCMRKRLATCGVHVASVFDL
ncbi:MAG: PIN domain-containing protein [Rhodoferax sp.]|nr:PIN domain-containing protein [Rhodoferax sp.]MCF8211003.1 PIN domain-containing protein [Rhodoferax sp.]